MISSSLRSRRLEVVGRRKNARARRRHSITPCVSPSRASVLSFAHYFQAPATQARYLHMWKDHRCYSYIIGPFTAKKKMVCYFVSVYIIVGRRSHPSSPREKRGKYSWNIQSVCQKKISICLIRGLMQSLGNDDVSVVHPQVVRIKCYQWHSFSADEQNDGRLQRLADN